MANILISTDNISGAKSLEHSLTLAGHQCKIISQEKVITRHLFSQSPDLVLLDCPAKVKLCSRCV